jgi:hypothetical protein
MAGEVEMKKLSNGRTALVLAAVICLGLGACGTGDEGVLVDGLHPSPPTNITVKTGEIATDSWGFTGSAPIQVAAPGFTEIVVKERTLLQDDTTAVVSGGISTRISFSSAKTALPAKAQISPPPGEFVSYVDISMGSVKTASPALSVTIDVGIGLLGKPLTVYNYDAGAGKWTSAQTVVVTGSGKITFPVQQLSLWAVFQ